LGEADQGDRERAEVTSKQQAVRVWSEQWMSEQPCPACTRPSLVIVNEAARDLNCTRCGEYYELKSSTATWPHASAAGSTRAYRERFSQDPPNLAVLGYRRNESGLEPRMLSVIPRTLVSEDMVIERQPSRLHTGRVVNLCTLDLAAAPHLGRVPLWTAGVRHPADAAAERMQMWFRLRVTAGRGPRWHRAVLQVIGWINAPRFTRKQLGAFEPWFQAQFPGARTPMQTVSRCLQELRDAGIIEFEARGTYRLL
jgi:type II restriction enzyme